MLRIARVGAVDHRRDSVASMVCTTGLASSLILSVDTKAALVNTPSTERGTAQDTLCFRVQAAQPGCMIDMR